MTGEPLLATERERVIEAVTTLFVSIDNRDWDAVRACFTEKVLFNTTLTEGNPEILSCDQIIRDWQEGLECLEAIHHQVGNFLVRFQENKAIVFCYGIAYHYLPNRSNRNTKLFVGSYDLSLVPRGWRVESYSIYVYLKVCCRKPQTGGMRHFTMYPFFPLSEGFQSALYR